MKKISAIFISALLIIGSCNKTEADGGIASIGEDVLVSMTVTAGNETVEAEIDQETHKVYLRHIPSGDAISKATVSLTEGASLATRLVDYYGRWPEKLSVTINHAAGTSTYEIILADYIREGDYYVADESKWKLVWNDEFNAPGIDWQNWSRCERSTPDWAHYMSDREDLAYIEDGALILRGIVNDDKSSDDAGFLTGGLSGKGKRFLKLGRVDIRAKFTSAQGFWPAIWMMPETDVKWPAAGEIDISEHINFQTQIHQGVHSTYTKADSQNQKDPVSSLFTPHSIGGYILFSVELVEDELIFRLDDEETLVYPKVADKVSQGQFPFDQYAYFMILSAQLGGSWPGDPEPSQLPATMTVDFVRFYANVDGSDNPNPDPDPDPDPDPTPDPEPGDGSSIEDPVYKPYE